MKYIVILCDGMADDLLEELDGRSPLEAAHTPNMDRLAKTAEIGMARTVPEGMAPGSDTANLSVIGYDPRKYYSGRSPLEALSIGAKMGADDVSFRCNLVTLSEEEDCYEDRIILDHSSGEISTEDAAVLLDALKKEFGSGQEAERPCYRKGYDFYAGTSYRHLLIRHHGRVMELTAPHDILTRRIGENPANSAWFWGAGTRPALTSFEEKNGVRGAMISAVDLLKGIAVGAGMHNITVEGANGGLNTNYRGKGEAAVKALTDEGYDFVYVHIEAPDEMGHQGSIADKIASIEYIDEQVIGPVADALGKAGVDFRMLVMPDHPTPVHVRTHTSDPVPYMLYDSTAPVQGVESYNEKTGKETGIFVEEGYRLIDRLLHR